ncbi:MAG: hypothetical protein QXR53_01435 [Candidatus Norongarragalinales archaeon]
MPVVWKERHILTPKGWARVVHLQGHDPEEIFKLVQTRGDRLSGHPPVTLYRHGTTSLVFRPRTEDFNPSKQFKVLQRMVEKRQASVEMPFALVEHPDHYGLLSYAKKGVSKRSMLANVINDNALSMQERWSMAKAGMRRLAEIHAVGFNHGHPYGNLMVDANNRVKFIDSSLVSEFDSTLAEGELEGLASALTERLWVARPWEERIKLNHKVEMFRIQKRLLEEYNRTLEKRSKKKL